MGKRVGVLGERGSSGICNGRRGEAEGLRIRSSTRRGRIHRRDESINLSELLLQLGVEDSNLSWGCIRA